MTYNKERHKELVIRSEELNKQGKNFYRENVEEYFELNRYDIGVEEEVFWTKQEAFVKIMKNFLDNILDFDEFETAFTLLYWEVRKEFDILKIDLEYIDKFQPSTRPYRFASFMCSIYREFEEVEDEYCTEEELKDSVKEAYLKFKNFEE